MVMEWVHNCFGSIFENISEGIMIIDQKGEIISLNSVAEKLLHLKETDSIGKKITDILPDTKLMDVLKTGEEELNKNFYANNKEFIVHRIPIKNEDQIIGAVALFQDMTEYRKMKTIIDEDRAYIDSLNTILDVCNERVVIVDKNGIITMMSKPYKEFLKADYPEGKHVTEVIENTRLHIMVKTGKTEIAEIQEINHQKIVAMRMPIEKNGQIVGAIGKVMFKDVNDLDILSKKMNNLQREVDYYKTKLDQEKKAKYSFENLVGDSPAMKAVKDMALKVAKTDSNVLIIGESGTGKELFVHSIHNASNRYLGPFVKINCAAIPGELLESELFGYEEGAFTGAKKGGKKGKFEVANEGTILLDEIGDMPLPMQAKLLRVLQEKELERVGGNTVRKINVRIIASTNKDLEKLVKNGQFRGDLFYRLNVMSIKLPPLRERKEDIEELVDELRGKVAKRLGIYVEGISKEAIECLENYQWPGNIRELENVIERAINLLDSDLVVMPKHLPPRIMKSESKSHYRENLHLKNIIEDIEREVILKCLTKTNWNKNKTAKILGISRVGLYKKIEKYHLESV